MKPNCFNCPSINDIRTHLRQACSQCKDKVIRIVNLWHPRVDAFINATKAYLFDYKIDVIEVATTGEAIEIFTSGLADALIFPPHVRQKVPNAHPYPILDTRSGIFRLYTPETQRHCASLFLWQLDWLKQLPNKFD